MVFKIQLLENKFYWSTLKYCRSICFMYENTEYGNFTYCTTHARINVKTVGHGFKIMPNTFYVLNVPEFLFIREHDRIHWSKFQWNGSVSRQVSSDWSKSWENLQDPFYTLFYLHGRDTMYSEYLYTEHDSTPTYFLPRELRINPLHVS